MNTQKKYNKARLLKETLEAYKSILIAEGFMDLLVDLVFGRQIVQVGTALGKDPEYIKTIKNLKDIEKNLVKLKDNYESAKKERLDYYFITYGIDLYDLDDKSRYMELYAIDKRQGKYKNIKPLDKKQQELNRKLVSKRR